MITLKTFQNRDTRIYLNPRLHPKDTQFLLDIFETIRPKIPNHLVLSTSGTSQLKLVAIDKSKILIAASRVNASISASDDDRWLNPLPLFHMGGISIYARAQLSHAKVFNLEKWSVTKCIESIHTNRISLISLVPTQLFDLVMQESKCPRTIRHVFVGGASLSETIYSRAIALGWPIIRCYGMTETAAQIMAEGIVYPHVKVRINTNNILEVKSDALLTGYGIVDQNGDIILRDPKSSDGWFTTGDLAKWNKNGRLEILGRAENVIKVSGEIVNLQRLNQLFDDAKLNVKFQGNAILTAVKDERLGYKIVVESDSNCEQAIKHYNQRCLPFEKVVS